MTSNNNKISKEALMGQAILIRRVEEELLELSRQGLLSGTVHTCIGQEYSALAFCTQMQTSDIVFSNHRCHGHYIARTGDHAGLIAEVMGKSTGTCGGIGGSQHLCKDNFYSNGIQGGILPVSAGLAMSHKLNQNKSIGTVFMGDGTLGEGLFYETMNIISKWEIPLLVVLENNYYAQTTSSSDTLAGDILLRAQSFGIKTYEGSTENYEALFTTAKESLDYVRDNCKPAFHLVNTYRLSPHSKGDDFREESELEEHRKKDPIHKFSNQSKEPYAKLLAEANKLVATAIQEAKEAPDPEFDNYTKGMADIGNINDNTNWQAYELQNNSERLINKINQALHYLFSKHDDVLLVGEDLLEPYGGAFKASKGLSDEYPDRIFSTPISEAAITGICNGLAIGGKRPLLEVMFGDFMTLTMDQLINHASKFYHMYNKQVNCPLIVRTPMGGKRGYGPTHSQCLDKFLIGIDNVKVLALNNFIDPKDVYSTIYDKEQHPTIVIENKIDYTRKFQSLKGNLVKKYSIEISNHDYPTLRLHPGQSQADVSIISYGATNYDALESLDKLFEENEILAEIIIPLQIHPLPLSDLISAIHTDYVFVLEEGSATGGFGSEVIAALTEFGPPLKKMARIASLPIPVPASKILERQILINVDSIVDVIERVLNDH